jgi:CRP/FNR family transcriptional regulator, cyclic AMP receptor protein
MLNLLERQRTRTFLRQGAWFKGMSIDLQDAIVANALLRKYETKQVLYREDRPSQGLYVVLQGQVLVTRLVGYEEYLFHVGGPGFWFGEASALTGDQAAVTVTARTTVRALLLPRPALERILSERPHFYKPFVELAARRLAVAIRHWAESTQLPPEEYLRVRLADFAAQWRDDGAAEEVIELALSQADLAKMLGVSRQTINVSLAHLQAQGLIEVSFRMVRILDPERLREPHRQTGP